MHNYEQILTTIPFISAFFSEKIKTTCINLKVNLSPKCVFLYLYFTPLKVRSKRLGTELRELSNKLCQQDQKKKKVQIVLSRSLSDCKRAWQLKLFIFCLLDFSIRIRARIVGSQCANSHSHCILSSSQSCTVTCSLYGVSFLPY